MNQKINPFEYSMSTIKSAFHSIAERIKDGSIFKIKPLVQDKKKELRYSKKSDFNEEIVEKYFEKKIDLNKNWKTYWRLPGNAGLEPLFTFDKSENVLAAKIMWPSPIIFGEENLSSIGYKDSVLLPLEVTPIDTSKPIKLEIQANIGLCEDVCIPVTLNVSYFATPGQNQENYESLGAILSEPIKSDDIGFQPPLCIIKNGELIMEFNEKNVKTGIENIELFVIEVGSSVFYVNSKKAYVFDDRITVSTKNSVETELPGVISRETIKTTIIGSNQSLEFVGCSG